MIQRKRAKQKSYGLRCRYRVTQGSILYQISYCFRRAPARSGEISGHARLPTAQIYTRVSVGRMMQIYKKVPRTLMRQIRNAA